jgi:hypothetical protein
MSWLEFVSSIVQSLAWPAAAVVTVILLRAPLGQLIPYLKTLKYKDVELNFAEQLKKVEEQADAANLPPPPLSSPVPITEGVPQLEDHAPVALIELANTSPRAAIGEAWRQLEADLRAAVVAVGAVEPASSREVVDAAARLGVLAPTAVALAAHLRHLRNEAVHNPELNIDLAQALNYISIVERVRASLPKGR